MDAFGRADHASFGPFDFEREDLGIGTIGKGRDPYARRRDLTTVPDHQIFRYS
jgi:hypothetical protein